MRGFSIGAVDERASEKQPSRADSAAMRLSSNSWPRKRMPGARRAASAARADADATPERDARVLQLERQLQEMTAALQASKKIIDVLRSEKGQLRQQLDELNKEAAAEHEKLLRARRERRAMQRRNAWLSPRAAKAASGWTKKEGQVTSLRQLLAEQRRQQEEDQAEIRASTASR